jgi:hypothetical protein
MHNLPRPIFGSHDHRDSQAGGGDGILSAELGLRSLNPDKVCQLRSYVARDGLSLNHLAISNLRCGVVNNGSGLLPSTCERAQGVTEGYVLSMGEPLLYGFRISFQKFTHRQIELLDQFLNVALRSHLDPPLDFGVLDGLAARAAAEIRETEDALIALIEAEQKRDALHVKTTEEIAAKYNQQDRLGGAA